MISVKSEFLSYFWKDKVKIKIKIARRERSYSLTNFIDKFKFCWKSFFNPIRKFKIHSIAKIQHQLIHSNVSHTFQLIKRKLQLELQTFQFSFLIYPLTLYTKNTCTFYLQYFMLFYWDMAMIYSASELSDSTSCDRFCSRILRRRILNSKLSDVQDWIEFHDS